MALQRITTEIGHSTPPEGPHTITIHNPGWDNAMKFRDGDRELLSKVRSLYPRFMAWGHARQLATAIAHKLGVTTNGDTDEHGLVLFTDPAAFANHAAYGRSDFRKDRKLAEGDLGFHVVDIHHVRLYCVVYPVPKTLGVIGVWQNTGTGLSTRTAEHLLQYLDVDDDDHNDDDDGFKMVEWSGDLTQVPPPTYLPESEAHAQLRQRICHLLHRQPLDPAKVQVTPADVYLYPTGMAAIHRLNEILLQRDPGTIVVVGSIFHNTFHLFEEAPSGCHFFGAATATSGVVGKLETYLAEHYAQGKTVSYLYVEFPSNPILVSADLTSLRRLADEYAFPLVVDDTIASFANVDVLGPVADILVTSLTKSFSGYADVMGGSVVLNPLSRHYPTALGPLFATHFHNEYFAGDAATMLANNTVRGNYFDRTRILNSNAAALAAYLATKVADPTSPVTEVLYPTTSDTRAHYEAFMRRPRPSCKGTQEEEEEEEDAGFTPGYGCLLAVDFLSLPTARAFYDHLEFHCGPHLGAHRTLALCFNAVVYGRDPAEARHHASYGVRPEQIRLSVGLEDQAEIVAAVEYALGQADEVFRQERQGQEQEGSGRVAVEHKVGWEGAEGAGKSEAELIATAEGIKANFEG